MATGQNKTGNVPNSLHSEAVLAVIHKQEAYVMSLKNSCFGMMKAVKTLISKISILIQF